MSTLSLFLPRCGRSCGTGQASTVEAWSTSSPYGVRMLPLPASVLSTKSAGYGLTVWIPVALLSIPPVPILRLVFSALAYIVSTGFLLRKCVLRSHV